MSVDEKLMIACCSTTIVLAIMSTVFWRGNRRVLVWAVAPLAIPPAAHIFNYLLVPAEFHQTRIIVDLAAALVACVLIGFATNPVSKTPRIRVAYLVCGLLFVLAFSGVLIMNTATAMNPWFPVVA